jgi:hypothetical protein
MKSERMKEQNAKQKEIVELMECIVRIEIFLIFNDCVPSKKKY